MIIQDNLDLKGAAFIMDFKCAGLSDSRQLGGKGATLVQLHASGFPVPAGFIITTVANEAMLESMGLGFDKRKSFTSDSARENRRIILAGTIPEAIREECLRGWQRLREESGQRPMAVRSSAIGEDTFELSFAGQYDSILNVESEIGLLEAIKKCWASLWSERAVAYRDHQGLDQTSVLMAIVVQPMVQAEISGIIFTLDPVNPASHRLRISVTPGVSESLASGKTTPEEWLLDRETLEGVASGTDASRSPLMDEAKIRELAKLAMRIESHFGYPQDIEWARADGNFVILQSRPITTLKSSWPTIRVDWGHEDNAKNLSGKLVYWSNWNTRENMPYPLRPLAWSFLKDLVVPAIVQTVWGIPPSAPIYAPSFVIDLVYGRVYWNMNLLAGQPLLGDYMMRHLKIFDHEAGEAFERIMTNNEMEPYSPDLGRIMSWKLRLRTLWTFIRYPWLSSIHTIYRRCDKFFESSFAYEKIPLQDKPIPELIEEAQRITWESVSAIFPLLSVSSKSLLGMNGIRRLTRQWSDISVDTLLAGIPGNRTSEGIKELYLLSQKALPLAETLANTSPEQWETTLMGTPAGRTLMKEMEKFLHCHGHRGTKDLDISFPNWKEDHSFVWQMIRNYWKLPEKNDPFQLFSRAADQRRALTREIEERITRGMLRRIMPWKRWLFRLYLRMAHDFSPLRENAKYYGMRVFPPVRRIFLEIGRCFKESGILSERDDIFFLSLAEMETFSQSPSLDKIKVQDTVSCRRKEWESFCRMDPPLIIRSDGHKHYSHAEPGEENTLRGMGASIGRASGHARIIRDPSEGANLRPGEILVTPYTEPGWTPLFPLAAALVMEVGGPASHGAIVAREYGIPAVVGVRGALQRIHDNDLITVDGDLGVVFLQRKKEPIDPMKSSPDNGQ